MNPFLTPNLALMLDAVGQAYSTRPSELMEFLSPGRALMFDIKVRATAEKELDKLEKESKTVAGEYKTKQKDWPDWAQKEIRR